MFHRASPSQRFIRTILAQKIGEDLVTRFLPVEIPSTETDPTTSPLPISFSPEMGRERESKTLASVDWMSKRREKKRRDISVSVLRFVPD